MPSETKQPVWKFVANLGDANPFEYGGYFVYRDETGVYPPEAELLELDNPDDEDTTYTVYRIVLEPCQLVDGVLSDNIYHPDYPAWFAQPERDKANRPQDSTYLSCVAASMGTTVEELQRQFCSDDPLERAQAYRCIGDHHGWDNLDQYPLAGLSRAEVEARYAERNR